MTAAPPAIVRYQAPGPISRAFLENRAPISILWGPVGSGKTVTALMRGLYASTLVGPEPDGVRRVAGAVIRRTYRDLWRSTIPSWWAWFPRSLGTWTGGRDEPATHELVLTHPDGGRLELSVLFLAFGEERLEDALRGLEIDWAYVDECDLVDERALPWLYSRTGRYRLIHRQPNKDRTAERYVWGTCNATDVEHWIWRDFVETPTPERALFRLPGGLDPHAERPPGITDDYYRTLRATLSPWEARRLVDAEPAASQDGDPVFRDEWNDRLHVAPRDLDVLPMRRLIIGIDAGGRPAATFWQRSPAGTWRGLDELATPLDRVTGPTRFGELLAQRLAERFAALDPGQIVGVCDPSAAYGSDRESDEADWIATVAAVAKIPIRPAPTNALAARLEAVRAALRPIDANTPGLVLSPRMVLTRRAFNGAYRLRRVITGPGKWRLEDKPDKNSPHGASHLMDSVQYALLHEGGYAAATARAQARREAARPAVAPLAFTV